MKKVIFLFNFSNTMPQPWLDAGYECWSFDGKHPDGVTRDGNHIRVGMWFHADQTTSQAQQIVDLVGPGVALVFGFPECTYLTVSGNRWFYHPDDRHLAMESRRPHPLHPNRRALQADAVELCQLIRLTAAAAATAQKSRAVPWAFENPARGHLSKAYRRPSVVFNPCDFGGYLPDDDRHPLFPDVYPPRDQYNKETGIWHSPNFPALERRPLPSVQKDYPGFTRVGGRSERTKTIRSSTPRGFALAVYHAMNKG